MASVSHELGGDRPIWLGRLRLEFSNVAPAARRIALFTLFVALVSLPGVVPVIGQSQVRVIVPALAVLCFAFTWLPVREAPIYALVYALAVVLRAHDPQAVEFDFAQAAIGIGEALALAFLVPRYLTRQQMIDQPFRVIAYILAALAISLAGASAMIVVTTLDLSVADVARKLGGSQAAAWRYWWLGHACSFVTITGTLTFIRQTTAADRTEILGERKERRAFLGYVAGHAAVALIVLPAWDMSWVGLPPDVRLGMSFLAIMTSIMLASRFRGFGSSAAILITTVIAVYSVTGPNAGRNWAGLPSMITPVYFGLMATTTVSWFLAITLRRLQWMKQEALEASAVKSRFIALMSHELRTPLNAILGFSELMRMQTLRELGEEVAALDNIHASGQRLLAMIESVLSHADKHDAIFALEKEQVSLQEAIARAIVDLNELVGPHSCSFSIDVPEELVVEADPRALRQILQVIIGYPMRFCVEGTEISVVAKHLGTDTVIEVVSSGLKNPETDESDRVEFQLANALALAHGARLSVNPSARSGRTARLCFFATRAA